MKMKSNQTGPGIYCISLVQHLYADHTISFVIKLISISFIVMFAGFAQNIESQSQVTDIDGNVYTTVVIGDQVWTAQNLRTTKYNDGSSIPCLTDSASWINDSAGAYCYYENDRKRGKQLGILYNWYAVNTGTLPMKGWHVPTLEDWNTLRDYLIANGYNYDSSKTGNKIAKSLASKTMWDTENCYGGKGSICHDKQTNNLSGFTGLPAGCRNFNTYFISVGEECEWWTNTEANKRYAYFVQLALNSKRFDSYQYQKIVGRSIRLVKD